MRPSRPFDEHTETTLVRAGAGLPVPAGALDAAARVMVDRWTNPADEENWLRRPAVRFCAHCGGRYTSRIALLAAGFYCSDSCEAAARRRLEELLG